MAEIFAVTDCAMNTSRPLILLQANPGRWVDFMMRFLNWAEEPDPSRARWRRLDDRSSYVIGADSVAAVHADSRYRDGAVVVGGRDSPWHCSSSAT